MTTAPIFTARPYAGDTDLPPICTLINTSALADGLDEQHSEDDLRRLLEDPLRDRQQDIRLWIDPAGQVAGFGLAFVPPPGDAVLEGEIYFAIRPTARHQGLESAIIAWGADRMRVVGQ